MIERLTAEQQSFYDIPMLRDRFTVVHERDTMNERFGLEPDRWDYGQMMSVLENLSKQKGSQHAVTVVGAYIEQLESRSAERALVADRLRTFERLMTEFFGDKTVAIDARHGFLIKSHSGDLLEEGQLSSGEFHLLLLMVAALVTRRRGTVIAIDEPEMSMHIAWQRKLVPALVECASKANPLFIFATHSPDLAASFSQAMVGLE
jgi:predicted ATPase